MSIRTSGFAPYSFATGLALALLALVAGCHRQNARVQPDPPGQPNSPTIFYFGGSGEAELVLDWASGVEAGLRAAGLDGAFHEVEWQTGLGPLADHELSQKHKREAADAAARIARQRRAHPGAPVHLIGLSTGTAVAVYTLEALPQGTTVHNVALLSSSLSRRYDLRPALAHVTGAVYVTVSREDEVLRTATKALGTASEKTGRAAGLVGFAQGTAVPTGARIHALAWRPAYERLGWDGSHTGVTSEEFVEQVLAPRLLR